MAAVNTENFGDLSRISLRIAEEGAKKPYAKILPGFVCFLLTTNNLQLTISSSVYPSALFPNLQEPSVYPGPGCVDHNGFDLFDAFQVTSAERFSSAIFPLSPVS
jgi:hypothetical protein